jgi:hypothetical protein
MKKVSLITVLCLLGAVAVWASPKSEKMTGWVSDAMCGAKGSSAAHAACAKKCVGGGEAVVFVTDSDQKVMKVANQDSLKDHAGEHVQIEASTTADGSLQVDKVTALPEKAAK